MRNHLRSLLTRIADRLAPPPPKPPTVLKIGEKGLIRIVDFDGTRFLALTGAFITSVSVDRTEVSIKVVADAIDYGDDVYPGRQGRPGEFIDKANIRGRNLTGTLGTTPMRTPPRRS